MKSSLASLLLAVATLQPAVAVPAPTPVFLTLGTGGGPVIRLRRSQPANAVVVGSSVYLFDAGDGVQRQLLAAGYQASQIKAVFLSHHHIDHTAGLGALLANRWLLHTLPPLAVIGAPGTTGLIGGLVRAIHPAEGAPITIGGPAKEPFAKSIAARDLPAEMAEPMLVFSDNTVRGYAIPNDHYHFPAGSRSATTARSYAFRIEAGGRSIVYTGDSGPSRGIERLARGADLLVSEVIDLAAIRRELEHRARLSGPALASAMAHMAQDHLTPAQVGLLATRAGVGQVVLTHLVPGSDEEAGSAAYAEGVRATFAGTVTVAADLDRF